MILKFAKEAQQEERKLWYDREKEAIKKKAEAGAIVNDVADKKAFQDAVKPVWDKYGAKHADTDQAHPGREVTLSEVKSRPAPTTGVGPASFT